MLMPTPRPSSVALAVSAVVFLAVATVFVYSWASLLVAPVLSQGRLPNGWSWGSAAALLATSAVVLALFGASLYQRLNTKLEAEELVVPTLRGSKRVFWSDIERISGRGMHIKLHTPSMVITVNPLCYARPAQVLPFLLSKVPARVRGAVSAA